MTEIVVATLTSADPADRPLVLLGGVPVPARTILLEERPRHQRLPDDPPDLRPPTGREWPEAQDVVLTIRAEPRDVDNGVTAKIVRRPARPWSAKTLPDGGYVCTHGSGRTLTLEEGENGEVVVELLDGSMPLFMTLHRDEILTLAAELIAKSGRDPE